MRLYWRLCLSILMIALGISEGMCAPKVAICQIVEHAALNQMREGVQSSMKDYGIQWTLENAQGNPTVASQIAQKLAGEKYDLIIALATPMAQSTASAIQTTPILFGAVSDPVSAKLVKSLEVPGGNITGVTDTVPVDRVMDLVGELLPKAHVIGLIYNSGEVNSSMQAREMKAYAAKRGYQVREATVLKSSDVLSATKSLLGHVDVIVLPTDNTVISALEAVTKPALSHNVPVIGLDVDVVRRGAFAALGVDWTAMGQQLAGMVELVLQGTDPKALPVQPPKQLYFHLNLNTAEKIGLQVEEVLLKKADKVYTTS